MIHIADAWKGYDDLTLELAREYPGSTFTCIRDIYGRSSIAVERLPADEVQRIKEYLELREPLLPYLGKLGVQPLEEGSSITKLVHEGRRRLGETGNAFVVERLLSNESWIRHPDGNPEEWPPLNE
jgi:hypothetical protein